MPTNKHPYPNNPYSRRKDEHMALATRFTGTGNELDQIHFVHQSLPTVAADQVDLSTSFLGQHFPTPLYINAMTKARDRRLRPRVRRWSGRCFTTA